MEEGQRLTLVEMSADVVMVNWDEADVLIRLPDGGEQDLTVEQTEAGPAVSARLACEIQVPAAAAVTIRQALANLNVKGLAGLNAEQVRGNLKLSGVSEAVIAEVYGNLKAETTSSLRLVGTIYGDAGLDEVPTADLQNVRGNLRVKASDRLRASRIGGNLLARSIGGALDVDQVGGNAQLKDVAGVVTLDQVAGNLVAKDLTGGAKVARIGGNLVFNGELGAGCTYHFKADGNAMLRLAEEANAHLTLDARGQLLSSLALTDQQREGNRLTGTLGDDGAEVAVEARGNILLGGGRPPFADLGEEISRQVEEGLRAIDLEAVGRQVSEEVEAAMSRLQVKLESVDWDRMGHQARMAVERAMERMQRDMDRLAEKAAHRQERLAEREARLQERLARREARLQERLAVKGRRAADHQPQTEITIGMGDWETEYAAESMEPAPSLDEERLSILKMVEQGQITPEEAEMLLDSLA